MHVLVFNLKVYTIDNFSKEIRMTNFYKRNVTKRLYRISNRKGAHKRLIINYKIYHIFPETRAANEIDANDMFLWRLV